ncbi:MAG TPA: hypothetical protein PKY77_26945 [Phycisphaerae bacterium]|nr:hypothetical protein [Phycisphaerae bacterium]HRY71128.1 hypothetical protein [Phycisphaerae bacterium]HSA30024.1 hypothetical protein [Phycisphaerae bacterium]
MGRYLQQRLFLQVFFAAFFFATFFFATFFLAIEPISFSAVPRIAGQRRLSKHFSVFLFQPRPRHAACYIDREANAP